MNRGAASAVNKRKPPAPRVPITIRLPKNVVHEIDLDLERRSVPVSRNNWLLEAVIEKLKRNGSGDDHGA
jgi:hypothetical protein